MQSRTPVLVLLMPVIAVLLAAGCGGKGAAPNVASLAGSATTTTTTTTSTPEASGATSGSSLGSAGGPTLQLKTQGGAKYSACMRKNGVPNFPDPSTSGTVTIGPSSGINIQSPKFRAAQAKCRTVLPNGGQPSPAQIAKEQQTALDYSKCMRKHGLPDFPDPTFSSTGGGVSIRIRITGGAGSHLNPNDPTFQAAQRACAQYQLGNKGGGATASSGK